MSEDFPEYDDASFIEHVAQNDYMIDVDFTPEGRRLLAIAKRLEAPTDKLDEHASLKALRRIARAAKPFAFCPREPGEDPREYIIRIPREQADEIKRAVDAIWGTKEYWTPPKAPTPPVAPLDMERVRLAVECVEEEARNRVRYERESLADLSLLAYVDSVDARKGGK